MSKTSSQHARSNSRPHQLGTIPYWVENYDAVVEWDKDKKIVVCKECHQEVKNLGWVRSHMRDCFGING